MLRMKIRNSPHQEGVRIFKFFLEYAFANDNADGFGDSAGRGHAGFIINQRHFAEDTAVAEHAESLALSTNGAPDRHLAGFDDIGAVAMHSLAENLGSRREDFLMQRF